MLLKDQGLRYVAQECFHRAGELGHAAALYEEGLLLKEQGLRYLAQDCFNRAA
jgi:hypothetical protein